MSISLGAFRFFFRSAQTWRNRRKPTVTQLDALVKRITRLDSPSKPGVVSREIGGVKCAVIGEEFKSEHCLLYIHGGGFGLCGLYTHYRFIRYLSETARACIVFPEYTKTPYAAYPVQLNECSLVYHELRNDTGIKHFTCMGDSAGGNLVTVIMNECHALSKKLPDKVVLMSPWQDLSGRILAAHPLESDDIFSRTEVNEYAQLYYGHHDSTSDSISPMLANYPPTVPTLLLTTTNELFYPIIRLFREQNQDAAITYVEREGLFHVWPLFVGLIPEATKDARLMADFIRADA